MNKKLLKRLRLLEADHTPDGWPAVQMKDISALCDELERMQTMVKVFRGCIETQTIPGANSPCYKTVIELVGIK